MDGGRTRAGSRPDTATLMRAGSPKSAIPKIVTGVRAMSTWIIKVRLASGDEIWGLDANSMGF
jgi:hypothetical protein